MASNSFFSKVNQYFREIRSEARKVVWPTRKQLLNNTIVVVVMIIIFGIFIWGTDALMGLINKLIFIGS